MSVGIMANKFYSVRAATCENVAAARCAWAVNDANVLCLGQLVTTPEDSKVLGDEFCSSKNSFLTHHVKMASLSNGGTVK
jgi:ribose 5-phosphate isomerase B